MLSYLTNSSQINFFRLLFSPHDNKFISPRNISKLSLLLQNDNRSGKMIEDVPETIQAQLEPLIVKTMAQNRIPGLSMALIKDEQIIYAKGFGARNLEKNLPTTPKTLYGVGSVTKSFTALAIMQLVEQGKLALDDPVQTHLPVKLEHSITLHHILSHTSGLPGLGTSEIRISRMCGTDTAMLAIYCSETSLNALVGKNMRHTLKRRF
jgi:CubicO group peptidase (beta-lactamase class C family)